MANLHRLVRIGEAGIIVILGGFAFITWRELSGLRKLPVSLPSYQFEVTGDSDANRLATTRGTWITDRGVPERLLTTTIECRKARMECVESEARVVFVSGQGLLESEQTGYQIERWTDSTSFSAAAASAVAASAALSASLQRACNSRASTLRI